MSVVISGLHSAIEAAKSAGLNNMVISGPVLLEMADYISRLENAERTWESLMMRLVGEDGPADVEKAINKLKVQAQPVSKLDQFAMSVCSGLVASNNNGSTFSDGGLVFIARESYEIAEAMQAESQKRQGGGV